MKYTPLQPRWGSTLFRASPFRAHLLLMCLCWLPIAHNAKPRLTAVQALFLSRALAERLRKSSSATQPSNAPILYRRASRWA